MRKVLFLLLLAASLQAGTFGYGSLRTMAAYPMAGLGLRSKNGMHALDLSGSICIWPSPSIFNVKALYIVYPQDEGLYLGAGVGIVNASKDADDFTGSFDGAIGFQWETARRHSLFLEANAMFPFLDIGEGWMRVWPGLNFGVGF